MTSRITTTSRRELLARGGKLENPFKSIGPLVLNSHKVSTRIPFASTDSVLVQRINAGCRVIAKAGGVRTSAKQHGLTLSPLVTLSSTEQAGALQRFIESEIAKLTAKEDSPITSVDCQQIGRRVLLHVSGSHHMLGLLEGMEREWNGRSEDEIRLKDLANTSHGGIAVRSFVSIPKEVITGMFGADVVANLTTSLNKKEEKEITRGIFSRRVISSLTLGSDGEKKASLKKLVQQPTCQIHTDWDGDEFQLACEMPVTQLKEHCEESERSVISKFLEMSSGVVIAGELGYVLSNRAKVQQTGQTLGLTPAYSTTKRTSVQHMTKVPEAARGVSSSNKMQVNEGYIEMVKSQFEREYGKQWNTPRLTTP